MHDAYSRSDDFETEKSVLGCWSDGKDDEDLAERCSRRGRTSNETVVTRPGRADTTGVALELLACEVAVQL